LFSSRKQHLLENALGMEIVVLLYSIFDSGVYRIHAEKWLFTKEKSTFDSLLMSTSEAKML
jgi:hypothetical protein